MASPRTGSRRARSRGALLALLTIGVSLFASGPVTSASAATPPTIERVSVSAVTSTDATLEATIDDGDQTATYDFELWTSPCSVQGQGCDLIEQIPLPDAGLAASPGPQTVSLDLNAAGVTLIPGGEYGYSLVVVGDGGEVTAPPQMFEAATEWPVTGQGDVEPLPIAVPPDLAVPTSSAPESEQLPSAPAQTSSSSQASVRHPSPARRRRRLHHRPRRHHGHHARSA